MGGGRINFITRAFWSIVYHKGRTILLFAILFLISNQVIMSLSIQQGADQVYDWTREQLGNEVILGHTEQTTTTTNLLPVQLSQTQSLNESEFVTAFNYISDVPALADSFEAKRVSTNTPTLDDDEFRNPDLLLEGVRSSDLRFEDARLVDGQHITEADRDTNVVLMEKTIAEINQLTFGDTITLSSIPTMEKHSFTIVGIYERVMEQEDHEAFYPLDMSHPVNTLYIPYTQAHLFDNSLSPDSVWEVIYYMTSGKDIDAFIKEAHNESNIDFSHYHLTAKDTLLGEMTGALGNVTSFSRMVLYLVTGTGVIMIGMLMIFTIKGRTTEIGILYALGESRVKICGQVLSEMVLIASLAILLSLGTGHLLSHLTASYLVEHELSVVTETSVDVEPLEEIQITLSPETITTVPAAILLIIVLASTLPIVMIVRFQPRMILASYD
ncbi:ABC transporter permease [Evansella tamaricis]|uniref:ABC transporter permease n=1 Tax=Evansella tamaricis TaxID=2069301 RepID=A0ABS6JKV1_9BACI|nr:ABC transporter permease [Evansella tamaricis]MBU9713829.1 ABC transporter permease [Evansella tamaricis]